MPFFDNMQPLNGGANDELLTVAGSVASLTKPSVNATAAVIQVVQAGTTDTTKAVRCTFNGVTPVNSTGTDQVGFLLGEREFWVLKNVKEINQFRALSADGSNTNYIYVQYYIDK